MAAPRHRVLTEELLTGIADGTYPVGSRFPTEEQLCATHGLARETVRRALRRLEELGLVSRRPGAGTTVVAARPVADYQPFARSAEDILALAVETRIVHPTSAEILLDADTARRVGADEGSPWFVVRGARTRRGDDIPVCWSEQYLRADLPHDKILRVSFQAEDLAGKPVEQIISAALLTDEMARALGADSASAALVITRRHYDRDGHLASVGIHTHPADRYQISTRL
ncbi:GntR family transcriptional regulator [Frankia sp. CNm7]|uniref:GntR family transcriptional regulator n=1 Tax=Frankia nepalensis TaxID=1836974 RepID=A0A937RED3_9ACTN|nr:GntR family transcriptional regulator [Frankia nepalensis]MBL7502060.1 GntR family transcriptional regulator [Frankia nepalensis]MBL7511966.1 GntR family transcriptional regulator [Frankia nepalensis]MBL7524044.1 GntR family transcriptional regulator [Frankia nepalensis]MBL7630558.1 GntR family transcriptional regulator [Frankia nepalensis]